VIELHEDERPEGVTMVTHSDSRKKGTTYYSSDQGRTAAKMEALKEHFGGTDMPYYG